MSARFQIGNFAMAVHSLAKSYQAAELFKKDNPGAVWLQANFPHLMSQLDELTFGWKLIPKAFCCSADVLRQQLDTYRKNMEIGLPAAVSQYGQEAHRKALTAVLEFLEQKVLPALERMPVRRKEEPVNDAFAEAFAESDSGADEEESEGDESSDQDSEAGV